MEILEFNARIYMALSKLATTSEILSALNVPDWATAESTENVKNHVLPGIRKDCGAAGFELAVQQVDKTFKAESQDEFLASLTELHSRIYDYLLARAVFIIPKGQREHYDSPLVGWELCCEKFPAVIDHIEEASRCYALGRNTACVFHLMAVAQAALESLSKKLSIVLDPHTDTWQGLINKIEIAIPAKSKGIPKPKWKAIEPFYAEIVSDLKSMKNAWRNPTMHFRRTYTDQQAEKIYGRVREFMAHASTRLRGPARKG